MVVPSRALLFPMTALGEPVIPTLGLSREPLRQSLLDRWQFMMGTLNINDGLRRCLYDMSATAFGMGTFISPFSLWRSQIYGALRVPEQPVLYTITTEGPP